MKSLAYSLVFCAIATGCTKEPTTTEATETSPPASNVSAPAASASKPVYEFKFGVKASDLSKDARFVRWEPGPCGDVAVARVAAIPQDDPSLRPDPVVEFDTSGKEIASWGKPYESRVTGFEGGKMRFETETGSYWTDAAGVIAKSDGDTADDVRTVENTLDDCPKLPTFSDSGAEQCFRIKDVAGKERLIAMEPVCS